MSGFRYEYSCAYPAGGRLHQFPRQTTLKSGWFPVTWSLRLEARIRPGKRQEFLDTLRTLPDSATSRPVCHQTLQDMSDPAVICWIGEWTKRENLVAFMASDDFRALKGAVSILGSLESEIVVESDDAISSRAKGRES
jgi:quinol monooxygenase YgiN